MWLIAVVFCLGCVFALAIGRMGGLAIARRLGGDVAPYWLPGLILFPALLPLAAHYQHVMALARDYASGGLADFGDLELAVPIGVIVVWLASSLVIRRVPLAALAFPMLSTFLYVEFVLSKIVGPPRNMPLEREAFVFLLGGEAFATCLLFGALWGLLGLGGMMRRWTVAPRR